jgi:hypothetical protein
MEFGLRVQADLDHLKLVAALLTHVYAIRLGRARLFEEQRCFYWTKSNLGTLLVFRCRNFGVPECQSNVLSVRCILIRMKSSAKLIHAMVL